MTIKQILDLARKQIGTCATNVKRCKYNAWYYGYDASGSGYDWCAVFVSWLFAQLDSISLIGGKNANCGYLAKQLESMGRLIKPSSPESGLSLSQLRAGDVVFFHWSRERSTLLPGTYVSDHVGIIESVGDGCVTTMRRRRRRIARGILPSPHGRQMAARGQGARGLCGHSGQTDNRYRRQNIKGKAQIPRPCQGRRLAALCFGLRYLGRRERLRGRQ